MLVLMIVLALLAAPPVAPDVARPASAPNVSQAVNSAFVQAAFTVVLNRTPAQADVAYWVQAGQTRTSVVQSLINSPECTNDAFLAHLYTDALGRPIDAQGEAYWNAQLGAGLSISGVAGALVQSPEGSSYETVLLYQNAMHRSGTPSGPTLTSAALAAAEQMMH